MPEPRLQVPGEHSVSPSNIIYKTQVKRENNDEFQEDVCGALNPKHWAIPIRVWVAAFVTEPRSQPCPGLDQATSRPHLKVALEESSDAGSLARQSLECLLCLSHEK